MANSSDEEMRPRPGIGWAFWIAAAVGTVFVLVYAIGGCLMQTIC